MNLQRLKHAWARGARIDWMEAESGCVFLSGTYSAPTNESDCIHPADAHLEYGPISSALIKRVATATWTPGTAAALNAAHELGLSEGELHFAKDEVDLMYWLFVAEFLADAGL